MRFESERHRLKALLPRPGHDVGQHSRMRAMHTIKVTHTQQRGAKAGGDFFEFVKNLHGLCGAGALARNGHILSDTEFSTPATSQALVKSPVSDPRARAPAPRNLNLKIQFHAIVGKAHVWRQ